MDERINTIVFELKKTADDVWETFGALTSEQLNWNPAETSWSVGQCLDHLIKTNAQFYPELERLAAGNRGNSFWENWSPFTGFFGRFLIRAVSDDSKKAKAPSKKIVPPSDVQADIVERFENSITHVNNKVTACASVDRGKTVITSPFLAVMTYRLDDAYIVLVEHTKRHIRQAKRVMTADGFPV